LNGTATYLGFHLLATIFLPEKHAFSS